MLATLLAAAALSGVVGRPAPAASAEDPRARRSALLLEAAELTDRLEASEAHVVAAQLRRARTSDDLAGLRARMRTRAVTAYMRGTGASVAALSTPSVYLEVVAAKEKELVSGYKAALVGVAAQQREAEAARGDLRAAQDKLVAVQAELDATIAVDDVRRAEELRRADEARQAALARQAAALATARGQAQAGPWIVTASAGGYAPSPLDPNALLPRHRAATDRQLALMRRLPFGPMTLGVALPAGLSPTGQRIEGEASWYGPGFNGRPTASGAIYDQEGWTVASKELPLGTLLAVTRGNRRVLLLVNDRGPYVDGRVLDLSAAAARALGLGGVATVSAEVVAAPAT
ncbi:MAG: septal ring lytic transglycosylase RlpA family protein [Acidimicrobiales bacterium]